MARETHRESTQEKPLTWEVTVFGQGTVYQGVGRHGKQGARRAAETALAQSRAEVVTIWRAGEPEQCQGGWADELAAFRRWQAQAWMARKAELEKQQDAAALQVAAARSVSSFTAAAWDALKQQRATPDVALADQIATWIRRGQEKAA